jgi:hypothetical protein
LLLSQTGYGDDFTFVKRRRTNKIISEHSQGRELVLLANNYVSHSFDKIKANFIEKNAEFFKSVYFDFAPLLAIPIYQERPVHSLKPVPDSSQIYSGKECEALANAMEASYAVHPDTKTQAILKSEFIDSKNAEDETCITAFSYDIEQRVDYVSVYGDDGHWHDVPVEWDDYLPLKTQNHFFVAASNSVKNKNVIANRNGLSIFN